MKRISKFPACGWLVVFVFLFALSPVAQATRSDVAKEARWAGQIVDSLLDGDAVWLDDGQGHRFLGILTEGEEEKPHAVILLHGIGVHPNWADVIYPLREALLGAGMTSLSLQMPILENEASPRDYLPLFDDVPGRIDAALNLVSDMGFRGAILVGHSMGAAMATQYLAQSEDERVVSLVIIGMNAGIDGSENISALQRIDVPVLDLYGSKDLEPVLVSASRRARAGRDGAGEDYRQVRVDGANHFFQGHEAHLGQHVIDWLEP